MRDEVWQIIRYVLIAGGMFFAGRGWVTMDQVNGIVAALPELIGGVVSLGTMVWGLYIKYGTRAVPAATAARSDVPTVSPATGAIQP